MPTALALVRTLPENAPITLVTLAAEITNHHAACLESVGSAAEHAWQAGRLLLAAKAQVPHGEWEAWVSSQAHVKLRTAQIYMRLAKRSTAAPDAVSIRSVLRGLAAVDGSPAKVKPSAQSGPDPEVVGELKAHALLLVAAGARSMRRAGMTSATEQWLINLIEAQ